MIIVTVLLFSLMIREKWIQVSFKTLRIKETMLSVHVSQISTEKINLNAVYTIDNRWKGNRNRLFSVSKK